MAFFSFKNPLIDKLLVAGCTHFSGLTQGSALEFFPSVTNNRCVMLSEDIKLEQWYINRRCGHLKQAFKEPNKFLIVIHALDHF